MFTGIVQARGRVVSLTPTDTGSRLIVEHDGLTTPVHRGDSVSVSGVCLTATPGSDPAPGSSPTPGSTQLAFDVVPQTLRLTTLGRLQPGDPVNLEPALLAGQPLGGHLVQGHIDGLAEVVNVDQTAGQWRVTLRPPADLMDYLTPKGSVTLDGVSLTLAAVGDDTFDVALIPETLDRTTFRDRQIGSHVNLEADQIAKTVIHWLTRRRSTNTPPDSITMDLLHQTGFLRTGRFSDQ